MQAQTDLECTSRPTPLSVQPGTPTRSLYGSRRESTSSLSLPLALPRLTISQVTTSLHRHPPSSKEALTQVAQVGPNRVGVALDQLGQLHLEVEREPVELGEEVAVQDPLGDRTRDRVVLDHPG